jgi:DNA replication protein DnaC
MGNIADVMKKILPDHDPPVEANSCPECGYDRAYCITEDENENRVWSPVQECVKCAEENERKRVLNDIRNKVETLMSRAGVPDRYLVAQISQMQGISTVQIEAVTHIQNGKSVVLWGGVGSGKTMLACAVLREMIWSGQVKPSRCKFVVVPSFLGTMKMAMDSHDKSPEAVVNELIQAEFLILDDVGAEHDTSWAKETLYRIINDRYNAMRQTVFTSNFKPEIDGTIAKILGQRIVSRLASYICVPTGHRDWRRG